jgi:hypothetical protein
MEHKNHGQMTRTHDEAVKHNKGQNTQTGNVRQGHSNQHTETAKRNNEKPKGTMAKEEEDVEERSSKVKSSVERTGMNHSGK